MQCRNHGMFQILKVELGPKHWTASLQAQAYRRIYEIMCLAKKVTSYLSMCNTYVQTFIKLSQSAISLALYKLLLFWDSPPITLFILKRHPNAPCICTSTLHCIAVLLKRWCLSRITNIKVCADISTQFIGICNIPDRVSETPKRKSQLFVLGMPQLS